MTQINFINVTWINVDLPRGILIEAVLIHHDEKSWNTIQIHWKLICLLLSKFIFSLILNLDSRFNVITLYKKILVSLANKLENIYFETLFR